MSNNYESSRIREIADKLFGGNKSDLARALKITPTGFTKYTSKDNPVTPGHDVLTRLASLGVNINWFLTGEGEMMKTETPPPVAGARSVVGIPVLSRVPAGIPDIVQESDVLDYLYLPDAPKNASALVVQGESMSGTNIHHGDYIVYVPVDSVNPGDVVVALNEFGAAMVKEYRMKDGAPWLVSTNPEFPSFPVNHAYRIVGKVVDVVRRIKV